MAARQIHNKALSRRQGVRWCTLLFVLSAGILFPGRILPARAQESVEAAADTSEESGADTGNAAGEETKEAASDDAGEVTQASIDSKKAAIEASRKERQEMADSLTDLQKTQQELESSKGDLTAYVTQLDAQLTSIQERVTSLEQQITEKEAEINATQEELAAAKEQQEQQYASMERRICFIYEKGDSYMLDALVSSGSISEMLNKATYIDALSAYDEALLEKYKKQTEYVSLTAQQLEEDRQTLQTAKDSLEEEQASMEQLVADKRAELVSVSEDIADQQQSVTAWQQQMSEEDAQIAALEQQVKDEEETLRQQEEARKKAEEEARRKAEEEARQKAEEEARQKAEEEQRQKAQEEAKEQSTQETGGDAQDAQGGSDEDSTVYSANSGYRYTGGQFTWPAPSSTGISSAYGYRVHPIYKTTRFHSGLDIAAPMGSPIVAAADGVVVAAAYNASMGNYVMIDHGDGLFTIYMHASQLECSKGDGVTAGQEIAKVGSTGASTGPHLHFSVRKNGQYVDPATYLGSLALAEVDEETAAQATE